MVKLIDVLGAAIPTDHARQVTLNEMFRAQLADSTAPIRVLDLGCGDGRALDAFARIPAAIEYYGIDIEESPEVSARTRTDANFQTFDGVNIPFADGYFDYVYSSSVLEHVRYPDRLIAEVARILKPGGIFMGSVSFLEPYHSYSLFNFTPYGIYTVLGDAGLAVRWLRPGIDGITLILRSATGRYGFFNRWFARPSPFNRVLDLRGRRRRDSVRALNAEKLKVCGHLIFAAER